MRRQTQSLRDTAQPRVVIETGNIRAEEDAVARNLWQRLREAANKAIVPRMLQVRLCMEILRSEVERLTSTSGTDGG